ncbi:TetR/AcrR family transcriptional regulator [Mycolicibacterium hodleri]|uniref:TetR/AcrR family transcriptional regulator n=1 Tax=Mycolicibacterium hodleri TaxID=49897 RepID=UPI00112BFCE1|nr:TetR/AcrR family transcriptional regulator [Mycolicibacterium hodleri]
MPSEETRDDESSVVDRLVRAADAELGRDDLQTVTIDVVAAAAGISRATAFRHLGRREDMIVAVALRRAASYAEACVNEINGHSGTFAQLEVAFLYLVRELPNDPVIRELLVIRTAAELDSEAHELVTSTLGPVYERGRRAGQIRIDVPIGDIITWTVEQLYLAMQQRDHSERAIRKRVQGFLAPALSMQGGGDAASALVQARIDVVCATLDEARQALSTLRDGPTPSPEG